MIKYLLVHGYIIHTYSMEHYYIINGTATLMMSIIYYRSDLFFSSTKVKTTFTYFYVVVVGSQTFTIILLTTVLNVQFWIYLRYPVCIQDTFQQNSGNLSSVRGGGIRPHSRYGKWDRTKMLITINRVHVIIIPYVSGNGHSRNMELFSYLSYRQPSYTG